MKTIKLQSLAVSVSLLLAFSVVSKGFSQFKGSYLFTQKSSLCPVDVSFLTFNNTLFNKPTESVFSLTDSVIYIKPTAFNYTTQILGGTAGAFSLGILGALPAYYLLINPTCQGSCNLGAVLLLVAGFSTGYVLGTTCGVYGLSKWQGVQQRRLGYFASGFLISGLAFLAGLGSKPVFSLIGKIIGDRNLRNNGQLITTAFLPPVMCTLLFNYKAKYKKKIKLD